MDYIVGLKHIKMAFERFIEIHDVKYFQTDIVEMSLQQIHMVCSFLDKENDLLWVQNYCNENAKHIIDNILFKM